MPVIDTASMMPDQLQVYSEGQALKWMRRAELAGLAPMPRGRSPMRDG